MDKIKGYIIDNLKKKPVLLKILTVSAFDLLSKATSVILFIILIRILTKEDYAGFTYFSSVAFFIFGAVGTGISASYVRFESERVSRAQADKSNLFLFYVLLIAALYLLLCIIAGIISVLPGKLISNLAGDSKVIYLAIAYSFALSIQSMNETYYQAREAFKRAGIIFCLKNILALAFTLIVAVAVKFELIHIIYIYIFTSMGIALYCLFRIISESKVIKFQFKEVRDNLRSSLWLILYCLFLSLFTQMDIFMVSALLDTDMLANYGVANKYYSLLLTLLPPIMTVLKVRTARADIIDDMSRQKDYIINWIRGTTPVVTLIAAVVGICAQFVFPVVNGAQYSASIPAFQILCVGVVFSYIFAPNVGMLITMRREKTLCLLGVFTCMANIAGNYWLIPIFGINAAALTTVISNAFINISSVLIVLNIAKPEKKTISLNSKPVKDF